MQMTRIYHQNTRWKAPPSTNSGNCKDNNCNDNDNSNFIVLTDLKFPVEMRTNWKMTCQHPLNIQADLWGINVHQGNTSSIMWLPDKYYL